MTIKDHLTKAVVKDSGYKNFDWYKTKDNRMIAKDHKDKAIAEYNFNNGRLKIL